jgi:hypothetical protein
MKIIFGLVFLLLSLTPWNGQTPSTRDLAGTYSISDPNVNDQLSVNSDHSYSYAFHTSNAQTLGCSGTWQYDSVRSTVTFRDFSFFNDNGATLPPGHWVSKVQVTGEGQIRLMYSSGSDLFFSKH